MLDASDHKNNSILSVHFMHFVQETLPDFLGHQVFQWVQSALGDPVLKSEDVFSSFHLKSVFTHVASIYINLLEQKKAFT